MFNTQVLFPGANPTHLVTKGQPCTLVNLDIANTVQLSDRPAFSTTDQQGIAPLGPLNSASFTGSDDVWGVASAVTVVGIYPYGYNWSPSPAQAAAQINALGLATLTAQNTQIGQLTSTLANQTTQIGQLTSNVANTIGEEVASLLANGVVGGAMGGTPLLQGIDFIQGPNQFNAVGPNTSVFGGGNFKKPGYIVSFVVGMPAATTLPFLDITMLWQDAAGSVNLSEETWSIPAVSAGSYTVIGKGPVKGAHLSLKITNYDPVQTADVTFSVAETTQHINRDDWRGLAGGSVPQWPNLAPGGDLSRNSLFSQRLTINNGVDVVYLMPLYAGQVQLQFATSSLNMIVNIGIPTQVANFNNTLLWQDATTSDVTVDLVFPRCPTYIEFHNTSGSNLGITCNVTADEFAS